MTSTRSYDEAALNEVIEGRGHRAKLVVATSAYERRENLTWGQGLVRLPQHGDDRCGPREIHQRILVPNIRPHCGNLNLPSTDLGCQMEEFFSPFGELCLEFGEVLG